MITLSIFFVFFVGKAAISARNLSASVGSGLLFAKYTFINASLVVMSLSKSGIITFREAALSFILINQYPPSDVFSL